jgi:fucose permease
MEKATTTSKSIFNQTTTPDQMSKTIGYYLAFIALGLINASLGPTLPGLAENTRTQLGEIGFLFTARSLGYLIGSVIGGRFYDRVPGHRVIAVAMMIIIVMLVLTPLMPLLWLLVLVLLVLGMAEGSLDVGGNTLLVWVHQDKVGPFMNALHFFFGIGAFLSPIIVAQALLNGGGILWAYWILALLILPVGLWFFRLPSPVLQESSKDDPQRQTQGNYLLVFLIALFFFLYVGAEIGFSGWIFTYATKLGCAEGAAAYLNSGFWGAFTMGRLLAIPLAARLKPRFILTMDLVGGLVSMGLILLWSTSVGMLWLGTITLGLALASIFPTVLAFAERRMIISGQITGWFFAGASSGAMVWPWLIGQLFDSAGPRAMMVTILLILMADLLILLVLLAYSARFTRQGA